MMKAQLYRTNKDTNERWAKKGSFEFQAHYPTNQPIIVVNSAQKFQDHVGFGGAFTEA